MGRKLVQFSAYFGRMGELDGQFVLTDEEFTQLESLYGKSVYFGEVLGKHSEVHLLLEKKHIKIVTDDESFLTKADELGVDLSHGHNPLSYWEDQDYEGADE